MREIKFRAWCDSDKMMYYDIRDGIGFDYGSIYEFSRFFNDDPNDYHKWTVMQYTGLKDKNGVEIYEGDLIRMESYSFHYLNKYIYEVYYNEPNMRFRLRNNPHDCDEDATGFHSFEVIGNIYQNRDLIDTTKP